MRSSRSGRTSRRSSAPDSRTADIRFDSSDNRQYINHRVAPTLGPAGGGLLRLGTPRKDSGMPETAPPEILASLDRMGLRAPGTDAPGERLTGGVSSDIWRIDLATGPVCIKRALAKLRVAADWQAPVERNRYEARWMQRANAAVP